MGDDITEMAGLLVDDTTRCTEFAGGLQELRGLTTITAVGHGFVRKGEPMNAAGRTIFVVLAMCIAALELRLGRWLPNVTAVGALALFAGSRMRLTFAWMPAIAVMAVSDWFLKTWLGYSPNWPTYACFVLDAVLGYWLIRRVTVARVGSAALLSAVQFFLITNFFIWLNAPEARFPKTTAGLLDCYFVALPFFRYTLLGNLGFAAVAFGLDAALARASVPAHAQSEAR
jgi:hypothetical protein